MYPISVNISVYVTFHIHYLIWQFIQNQENNKSTNQEKITVPNWKARYKRTLTIQGSTPSPSPPTHTDFSYHARSCRKTERVLFSEIKRHIYPSLWSFLSNRGIPPLPSDKGKDDIVDILISLHFSASLADFLAHSWPFLHVLTIH